MAMPKWKRGLGLVLPVSLLALLLVLGALQYRWTGAVSRAEADRLRANLESSLARFSHDFDEELAQVVRAFLVRPTETGTEALASFRQRARYPEIVDGIYRLDLERDPPRVSKLQEDGTFATTAWPLGLEWLRGRFATERHPRGGRPRGPRPIVVASGNPLALLILAPGPRARAATVFVFRNEVISEHVLPDLTARHFGSGQALDFDVAVLDESERLIYSSRSDGRSVLEAPDASMRLLSLHGVFRAGPGPPPPPPPRPEHGDEPGGRWTVYARHRAGSLDAVVDRARTWNLALGSGVLLVLGVSIVLVTVSARRAMELSERRMEFVAGVSHELRTPLAVIRSAAQNLSDGSVSGAEQVKRYGGLIEAEGRRLGDLVEKVLELAGVESHARRPGRERVSAARVIQAAVEDCQGAARDRGVEVTTSLASGDPEILGDAESLRRGVSNLLANAVKHGDGDNSVTVALETRGGEVVISVSDRGPGIHPADLPHLFDAFYRGRRAREEQVAGSGLGLSLVQHIARDHGGRVEVESKPGRGSRFSLILPEAPRSVAT